MLRTFALATSRRYFNRQINYKPPGAYPVQSQNVSALKNPQNLPNLPVPTLAATFDKYIKSVTPFLSSAELEKTKELINEFTNPNGIGVKLQEYLEQRAKETHNWLEDWWLETAYLSYRDPVVVYSSPGQAFPFQEFKNEESRLHFCSKLILAAATYKMLIDEKKLPVDKAGKDELDMNQYNKIFGTCRIPKPSVDGIKYYPKSKHIVLAHKNNFFKMDIFNDKNLPLSEGQLYQQLNKIVKKSSSLAAPVGVLTSENRDVWAQAYSKLITDSSNKASVSEIQKALFLVCLDPEISKKYNESRQSYGGRIFIHGGGGTSGNAGNRWYDKTVQFILVDDGTLGLTYEHSPSEGTPIAVMVDYLDTFIKRNSGQSVPDAENINEPTELKFKIDSDVKNAISTAQKSADKLADNLELECFTFKDFGKEDIKALKFSPDSFIQIAFQYTFYRIYKSPAAHYESAGTRKYVGGRTETIRSCSIESVAFAEAMLDTSKSDADKFKAMHDAIQGHKLYSVEAVNGFGVDRHLLGLKLAAKALNIELPALYKDPSFTRSTHMQISSSQVATKCDGFMCYAPLTEDGYGCCYNPRKDTINFAISSFASNSSTSAKNFRVTLEDSLRDMKALGLKMQKSKL